MAQEGATQAARKKKERSPGYPGINLEEAIERARQLYQEERRNYAPVSAILEHWGYQPKSGAGLVALAALKKFGLLEDEGSSQNRRGRLTDAAFRILADSRPDSAERQDLIKQAALTPTIHRELWEQFNGDLPSDANLDYELRTRRHFTDSAARDFIREFRETVGYAGLDSSDSIGGSSGDTGEPGAGGKPHSGGFQDQPMTEGRIVAIPLGPNQWATLQASFPLSKAAWDQMKAVLEAMRPALVQDEPPEVTGPSTELDD